jgi:S-adenosylmethionine:tRNA ribosyltransferase-isomerase
MRHRLSDFDYPLPPELVAQAPARERAASRLLHVEKDRFTDLAFREFPGLVQQNDVVVINDTRVIHARLRGMRPTGGRVEILIERIVADDEAWVQMKASHLPKVGGRIDFPAGTHAVVLARDDRFFHLRCYVGQRLEDWLARHGEVPLPPYITHAPNAEDEARYQTIYARVPGAVAAPTAGLHVDEATLAALAARGVTVAPLTLHVGAGTFQPLQSEDIDHHRMHAERYAIPEATAEAILLARARGGRVLAIGTTSLRALESAADERGGVRPGRNETALYITPGYRFRVVDRLLTNFHLPRSTLLVLVSAFAGLATIRRAYAHAIEQRYRFFSYGDCMLLERSSGADDSA